MKRFHAILAAALCAPVAAVSVATTACTSFWQTVTPQNIANLVSYLQTAVSLAQAVWQVAEPLLSADIQATANDQFNKAVLDVENIIAALVDAENGLSQDGGTPDLLALVNAAKSAASELEQIVVRYVGSPGAVDASVAVGGSAPVQGLSELHHEIAIIEGWHP